jgi:hypothetical protein
MMLKAFRNKDQRDIDETTGTSRRGISAAIYVLPRDFGRRQHYAWFPARLALSDSHSLRCCGDAGPRISGFHLPGFKWSTWSRKGSLSLSIHRAQGPDGYVRRRFVAYLRQRRGANYSIKALQSAALRVRPRLAHHVLRVGFASLVETLGLEPRLGCSGKCCRVLHECASRFGHCFLLGRVWGGLRKHGMAWGVKLVEESGIVNVRKGILRAESVVESAILLRAGACDEPFGAVMDVRIWFVRGNTSIFASKVKS